MNRRFFLTGLITAPAIVRFQSIMPVRAMPPHLTLEEFFRRLPYNFDLVAGNLLSEAGNLILQDLSLDRYITPWPPSPNTSLVRLPNFFLSGTRAQVKLVP